MTFIERPSEGRYPNDKPVWTNVNDIIDRAIATVVADRAEPGDPISNMETAMHQPRWNALYDEVIKRYMWLDEGLDSRNPEPEPRPERVFVTPRQSATLRYMLIQTVNSQLDQLMGLGDTFDEEGDA